MFYGGESGSILGNMARIWFAHPGKGSYSSTCCCDELKSSKRKHAVVAQLVEHHLAKVDVASSSLVNRSTEAPRFASGLFRCVRGFITSGVLLSPGFVVSGSFSFWMCRAEVLRSFPRWLLGWGGRQAALAIWLSDCPVIWLSGGNTGKIFKKNLGLKACGGGRG